MVKRIYSAYQKWVFNAYSCTVEQLGVYRIFYTIIIVLLIGIPQYANRISRFPEGIFNPPPLFSLFFSEMPELVYFQITDVLIIIGFFAVFMGFFTRTTGIITALIIIVNNGFIFSSGKIDHSFLVWFALLLMSFSGWGKCLSVDQVIFRSTTKRIQNWPLSLLSMGLGFGFFTAGLIKLVSGWLSFSDSMLRAFYLRNFYVQNKQDYLASLFENFNFFPFWELGDWFTILFEIGFLFVIFNPILFRFFTGLAVFFHGMILLMMNIAFAHYLAIYLAFWIPLYSGKLTQRFEQFYNKLILSKSRSTFFGMGVFILYLLIVLMPGPLRVLLRDSFLIASFLFVTYLIVFKPRVLFATTFEHNYKDIIRFDGVCNLCNSFVQFVLKRDADQQFRFGTLQGKNNNTVEYQTVEVESEGSTLKHSTAFLSVVRRLKGLWPYLYVTVLIPQPIRDGIYHWIARNRYRWFGKRESCMIPSSDVSDRFVD